MTPMADEPTPAVRTLSVGKESSAPIQRLPAQRSVIEHFQGAAIGGAIDSRRKWRHRDRGIGNRRIGCDVPGAHWAANEAGQLARTRGVAANRRHLAALPVVSSAGALSAILVVSVLFDAFRGRHRGLRNHGCDTAFDAGNLFIQ